MMANLNKDATVALWMTYLTHCTVTNECYLLREEKVSILNVLKYGRRLDP